jgi:hypothetical protein
MPGWTIRQTPHPRDRRPPPAATGLAAALRRLWMRWRLRWVAMTAAARGALFRVPNEACATHRRLQNCHHELSVKFKRNAAAAGGLGALARLKFIQWLYA